MKNIYFGLIFATIFAFSACSDDNDNNEPSSSSDATSSSSSISHLSPACHIPAPEAGFSLCWENAAMTQTICDKIANDYKKMGAGTGQMMDVCPEGGVSCSSQTGATNAYVYNQPAMPTCQMIVNVKIE